MDNIAITTTSCKLTADLLYSAHLATLTASGPDAQWASFTITPEHAQTIGLAMVDPDVCIPGEDLVVIRKAGRWVVSICPDPCGEGCALTVKTIWGHPFVVTLDADATARLGHWLLAWSLTPV